VLPAGVVGLREREDLLELVEDEDGRQHAAVCVLEDVVAVVEEFPERLAGHGGAALRPAAGGLGGAEDRALDLLGRRRRVRVVVEAHIDGAEALGPEARHEAGLQDGGLAEAGLAEEDREELALDAAAELGRLLVAAVEVRCGCPR
jgi:AcrR family transcriptional regulator